MNPYEQYGLYIAGPQCFYPRGYSQWHGHRKLAEFYGFTVVLPNDHSLKLDHDDPRKNADAIFADLREVIERTDIIIADLEHFRGTEPDGGTLFEMGMTWARGGLLYGYTRDKRPVGAKNPFIHFDADHRIRGRNELGHPYADMPFVPSIVASTMVAEGDFHDGLKMLMADLDERKKRNHRDPQTDVPEAAFPRTRKRDKKTVFLSGPARYHDDGAAIYKRMKAVCGTYGYEAVSPLDGAEDLFRGTEDPVIRACMLFDHWQEQLRSCDIFLGDLNDYNGLEPCGDTAFEAGVAWKLGKECYGYMDSASRMLDRIPNRGGHDVAGNVVENFEYPLNLMFSCSMPILSGSFEHIPELIKAGIPQKR
ncbi:MAG: nucleoside 2-deoxyribosyltransferase [Spirochaetaceae bacterium]|jgi:nucleoside 2-deoxyribosyltransferase|nr:nucleoside 2-deoxyribosyltransferase [Spirochaetaceae bacterium]